MIEFAQPGPGDDAHAFRRNGTDIPATYSWAERLKREPPYEAFYHPLDHATVGRPIRKRITGSMFRQFTRAYDGRRSSVGRVATLKIIDQGLRMLDTEDWQTAANHAYRAIATGQASTDQRAYNLLESVMLQVDGHTKFAPALRPIALDLYDTGQRVLVRASFNWNEFSGVQPNQGFPIGMRRTAQEPSILLEPVPVKAAEWTVRDSPMDRVKRNILYSRPVRFVRRNILAAVRRYV